MYMRRPAFPGLRGTRLSAGVPDRGLSTCGELARTATAWSGIQKAATLCPAQRIGRQRAPNIPAQFRAQVSTIIATAATATAKGFKAAVGRAV
mmetsp:Transcript_3205/g.9763  ORF Transcript_3205/g.9763 Transcript_3205/m.9763 type:complete len:93 (-) Transcript_3205:346-624(-)